MGGAYALGGLGSRSTLSRVKMSPLGSSQCCSGFLPGTDSDPSMFGEMAGEEPKSERAAAEEASKAVVTERICMAKIF